MQPKMTSLAKSILIFGIYIGLTGICLLLFPKLLLSALMIAETPNVWMQLLGLALGALGIYYIKAAIDNNIPFFRGTIPIRILQLLVVLGLTMLYSDYYILIGISSVEFAAGLWTWYLLKKV